ncbi:MAG TPA: cytochrome c oxidase assembly protein [Candidatus Sulfotelmatobacter sp.]|nr:cytochrome c oxidase assembly protein [Candidatus Sulfotelmatobacter sp.]
MTPETQAALHSWSAPVGVDASLCVAAMVYTTGWNRLRTVFATQLPLWRLAAFLAGVVAVWIAIGSPLEALDDASLTVHMVQHLLLSAIAPPLILLGAPALPLLRGLPQSIARKVASPVLRLPLVKRLGRLVSNPAICWLAAALALIGWHIPSLFELALRLDWLHKSEHATFFGAGLMFWWPVVQPWPSSPSWPRWAIPLYLFAATLPCDALSGFLTFCDRVVYPSYFFSPRLFGLSPLEDQQCAAALMWVSITLIFLIPAVLVILRILSPGNAAPPEEIWAEWRRLLAKSLRPSKPEAA